MEPLGKGIWTWQLKDCEGGDATKIANEAVNAGLSHVYIKIADGPYVYNYDTVNKVDRIPPVVAALRAKGLQVWGWHYIYGLNPTGEANIAISQVKKYNLDGYVIDAEGEFKLAGKDVAAQTFVNALRAGLPSLPIALSSYRYPSYHQEFPWKIFLEKVDWNMPLMYWVQAHNPAAQLQRCVDEFKAMAPFRPIFPVGPAYQEGGWAPTAADQVEFWEKVQSLGLRGASWFSWDNCRAYLPTIWSTISELPAPTTPAPVEIIDDKKIKGKGFWIWKVKDCEGGDATKIANEAVNAGLSHVYIKIADGPYVYNYDTVNKVDRIPPVVAALRAKGLQVWGWHYIYGLNPTGEANIAISQVKKYNLDGYVIDAEGEFKLAGKDVAAQTFVNALRAGLPSLPIALSSYRYPSYHQEFPWKIFLEKVDWNMPLMYWVQAHNPAAQLQRCVDEFKAMAPFRPIFPVGPAYQEGGWAPTAADQVEFWGKVQSLGLRGASWFSWDECKRDLPSIFTAIGNLPAPGVQPPVINEEFPQLLINALNSLNDQTLSNIYDQNAVMIMAERTYSSFPKILEYYSNLSSIFPSGIFTLTGYVKNLTSYTFNWTAISGSKQISDGKDTIGIKNNKIIYHYRSYTIT